jgi:hypothetical protein
MEEKNKNKNLPSDLVLNSDGTATFTLREDGDISGTYAGTFVFKCYLTPLDTLSAGKLYRDLLGPHFSAISDTEHFIATALSQLAKRIVKSPPFWNTDSMIAGNIPDLNILTLVLDRSLAAELAYKELLKEKRDQALERSKKPMADLLDANKTILPTDPKG